MNITKWIKQNTASLSGKKVAVTGSTGGIGKELCRHLAGLGASLVLMDRNSEKSRMLGKELEEQYNVTVEYIRVDMEDMGLVSSAAAELVTKEPDIFIHNAGAYSIPRHRCSTGFDNVFQINFVSPYYIIKELLPVLRRKKGRAVVVGSIAHGYSKSDRNDIDFSSRRSAALVYGNAKRYLMFSLYTLFENEREAGLAVTHPGITLTNITAHYPKPVFALIKHPMKLIFMSPKKAALSVVRGAFVSTPKNCWIGPGRFNIWGYPALSSLRTCKCAEAEEIFSAAENIYLELTKDRAETVSGSETR